MVEEESRILHTTASSSGSTFYTESSWIWAIVSTMRSSALRAACAPALTPGAPCCGLHSALCSDGCRQVLLFGPWLASHEFSLVGNTSLKKVLLCVCSCCSWHTLFCGPRYWRLLLFVSFFFFPCVRLTFPIWCVPCYQFLLLHPLPLCLSWLHRYLSQASWPGCRKTVSLDKLSY